MAGIVVTQLSNGIKFDLSSISGAGTTRSKYLFRPSLFHTIVKVAVQDDFMQYETIQGEKFSFNYNGSGGGTQIDNIDGVAVTDNYDLFNKFIAIL